MFISFLRQVEVWPLRDIDFGIDYDTGNTFDTKVKEPRVQTRLCLAERKGFEPLRQFPDDRISSAARYDLFDISPIWLRRGNAQRV